MAKKTIILQLRRGTTLANCPSYFSDEMRGKIRWKVIQNK